MTHGYCLNSFDLIMEFHVTVFKILCVCFKHYFRISWKKRKKYWSKANFIDIKFVQRFHNILIIQNMSENDFSYFQGIMMNCQEA